MMLEQEMRIAKDRLAALRNSAQQTAASNAKVAALDSEIIKLQDAIEKVYREGKFLTGDVGGTSSTEEFTDEVVRVTKER